MEPIRAAPILVYHSASYIEEIPEDETLPLVSANDIDSAIGDSDHESAALAQQDARATRIAAPFSGTSRDVTLRLASFNRELNKLEEACHSLEENTVRLSNNLEGGLLKPFFLKEDGIADIKAESQLLAEQFAKVAGATQSVKLCASKYHINELDKAVGALAKIKADIEAKIPPQLKVSFLVTLINCAATPTAGGIWYILLQAGVLAASSPPVVIIGFIAWMALMVLNNKVPAQNAIIGLKSVDRQQLVSYINSLHSIYNGVMSNFSVNSLMSVAETSSVSASHALAAAEHSSTAADNSFQALQATSTVNNGVARLEQRALAAEASNRELRREIQAERSEAKEREKRIVKDTVKEMLASLGISSSIAIPGQGVGNTPPVIEPAGLASSVSSNESSASANTTSSAQDLA